MSPGYSTAIDEAEVVGTHTDTHTYAHTHTHVHRKYVCIKADSNRYKQIYIMTFSIT